MAGDLRIELLARDFASKVLADFGSKASAQARRVRGEFDQVDKAVGRSTLSLGKLAAAAGAVYAGVRAGQAITRLATGLVQQASDFEERISKFAVVFGAQAEAAGGKIDKMADAVGRSRSALVESAASFQGLLTGLGLAREDAAGLSTDLAQLTVDLASFENLADKEAQVRIFSGIVGETEAVRRFGADLSAASVEAEALRRGLAATTDELTNQDKVLARIAILYKATRDAQGDAERTSGSYANTIKKLEGGASDLAVAFGGELRDAILQSIENLGGVDRVLDLIEVGMAAVTGAGKLVIKTLEEGADVALRWVDRLGGADVVASALTGHLDVASFAAAEFSNTLEFLGTVSSKVFESISASAIQVGRDIRDGIINAPIRDFKLSVVNAQIASTIEVIKEAQAEFARLRSGKPLTTGIFGSTEEQVKETVERSQAALREMIANREKLNDHEKDAGQRYTEIWSATFDEIETAAELFAERTRANFSSATDVQDFSVKLVERLREIRAAFGKGGEEAGEEFRRRAQGALEKAIDGGVVEKLLGSLVAGFKRVVDAGQDYAEVGQLVERFGDGIGDSFDRQRASVDRSADALEAKIRKLGETGVATDELREKVEEYRRALLDQITTAEKASDVTDRQRAAQERLREAMDSDSVIRGATARLAEFNEESLRGGALGVQLADSFIGSFDSLSRTLLDSEGDFSEWGRAAAADLAAVLLRTALLKVALLGLQAVGLDLDVGGGEKLLVSSAALAAAGTVVEGAADKMVLAAGALAAAAAAIDIAIPFAAGGIMPGEIRSVRPARLAPAPKVRAFGEGGIMPGTMRAAKRLAELADPEAPYRIARYDFGGIADTPQVAVFGEGRGAEAFVPLGADRKIPVKFPQLPQGGLGAGGGAGNSFTFNMSFQSLDPRGSQAAVRAIMPEVMDQWELMVRTGVKRGARDVVRTLGGRGRG